MDPHPPADPRRALYSAVAAQPCAEPDDEVEVLDPGEPLPLRQCAFCGTAAQRASRQARCSRCDSPLATALLSAAAVPGGGRQQGRRAAPRFTRDAVVQLHLPGQPQQQARLRDVSLSGLSLGCGQRLAPGQVLRAVAPGFDAVAQVVDCRRSLIGWRVHARLLALQPSPAARGVFVSAKV